MIKSAALALGLLAVLSAPAIAGPCDADLKTLDAALTGDTLKPDVRPQLQDMRDQAEELCKAGNEEEAADVLSEAAAIIEQQ